MRSTSQSAQTPQTNAVNNHTKRLLRPIQKALVLFGFALGTNHAAHADWKSVTVEGGGYVTGLAASTLGDAFYMRTDVGGAYRWDAANVQWLPITDTLPGDTHNNGHLYGIGSLAVDPMDADRVFIACGKYDYSTPSGIYVCDNTDSAAPVWTPVDTSVKVRSNQGARQAGERLTVDPYNSNVVYFGTYNISGGVGVRKYDYDNGWYASTLTPPALGDSGVGIIFVTADPNGGSVSDGTRTVSKYLYIGVYSATAGNGGIYASDNGGSTWTKVTGVSVDKPARGEVASDGTLYVTSGNAVVKVARGSTTATSISPLGGIGYCALAVDPVVAGTVMVGEFVGSNRIWRSTDHGASWALMNRNVHATEPDGTKSMTSSGKFDHVADMMINPANPDEVWASDFFGVQRTQEIQDDTQEADWFLLQRNHEEIVPLNLTSAPSGAPLISAVADVNGFVHYDVDVRPSRKISNPSYISSTSLDFSEATSGSQTAMARVGHINYYTNRSTDDQAGGFSTDGGETWACFGQLAYRAIYNSATPGWEEFEIGPYLKKRKAEGANSVTIVVRSRAWQSPNEIFRFSSKEGTHAPELLLNGNTTLITTADAFCYQNSASSNYGTHTELRSKRYYNDANRHYWSYIKFDLSSVTTIDTAVLRLYRMAGSETGYVNMTYIMSTPTTSWDENTITWSNKPTNLYEGPGGAESGRIAVSSSDPTNMVWVAGNGYVWYSKDRGVTWARGTRNGSNLSVESIALFDSKRNPLASDRVAPDTFYLYKKSVGSGTVYRSTDGGATWSTLVSSVGTADGYKLKTLPGVHSRFWFVAQNWNSQAHFKYWNGSSMVNVPNISNVVDFAFGKAAPGNANPTVYVRKKDFTYWYSTDATAGTTFTWTQMNVSTINNVPHIMEGDRQTFGRLYVGTNGRGIYYADISSGSDATPPSLPQNLTASAVSTSQINLTWDASTDNVGVQGYDILRNLEWIDVSLTPSYSDSGLSPNTSYTYTVAAFDAEDNTSANSAPATATTQGAVIPNLHVEIQGVSTDLGNAVPYAPQDFNGACDIDASGTSASLAGNAWKRFALGYTVTADTILEFTVNGTDTGEICGIALDNETDPTNGRRAFRFAGTDVSANYDSWSWEISPAYTSGSGDRTFQIPVGSHFTGEVNYLGLFADDDANVSANITFSNIKLYEQSASLNILVNDASTSVGEPSAYSSQDGTTSSSAIGPGGNSVELNGNAWKQFDLTYTVTANTMLEVTVQSTDTGEIAGIALDNDSNPLYGRRAFLFGGSDIHNPNHENWSWKISPTYSTGSGQVTYVIPAGSYFTGSVSKLGFIADDDANSSSSITFSNIKLYEQSAPAIDFSSMTLSSYDQDQDAGNAVIEDNGATLHLSGNAWKKIDLPFTLTANSVLEFDYKSSSEGDIHGIGFDTDDTISPDKIFELHGTQTWGIQNHNDYSGSNWKHYSIPVGQFLTGNVLYLVFTNDHDVTTPTANGYFRNVKLY
ncbi:DNRLRE domain-containing protein [Kiritimatiellaeota bacterium B1221]|nr:DNRLRE domain-containing protein [Kiritimatiellaeota bacterium B1221]